MRPRRLDRNIALATLAWVAPQQDSLMLDQARPGVRAAPTLGLALGPEQVTLPTTPTDPGTCEQRQPGET